MLIASTLSVICLLTPTVYQRVAKRTERTSRLRWGIRMTIAGDRTGTDDHAAEALSRPWPWTWPSDYPASVMGTGRRNPRRSPCRASKRT